MAETDVAVQKMTRELKAAAGKLSEREARYLVDVYYSIQDFRIQAGAQVRAGLEGEEPQPHSLWLGEQMRTLEGEMKKVLHAYAKGQRVGRWLLSIYGIGPVIAAGFLSHFDIRRAPTAGHFWSFAGLNPTAVWEKGKKRPWNAKLKRLCWIAGESFKKFSAHDDCFYGHIYRERKALEVARNEALAFREQAEATLASKRIGDNDTRRAYEQGMLPPGRLDLRATRYAVKLLLAHLHHCLYEEVLGEPPPKPYIITHSDGAHTHIIGPPGWPCP